MNSTDCITSAHYNIQHLLYKEAMTFAKEGALRFDNDYLLFWNVYANFKSGAKNEAVILLSDIDHKPDIQELAQKLKSVMTGQSLAKKEPVYRPGNNDLLFFNIGLFYLYEEQEKLLKSFLKNLPNNVFYFELLRGMVALRGHQDSQIKNESSNKLRTTLEKAKDSLLKALDLKPDFPMTLLALIELEEKSKQVNEMGVYVNRLAEILKNETIVGLERVKYFIVCENWDLASSYLEVQLANDPENVQLLKLRLLEIFVKASMGVTALEVYSEITRQIEHDYGFNNNVLLLSVVSFVNKVGGNSEVLTKHSIKVLTKARGVVGNDYGLLTELGFAYLLIGDLENAEGCYQKASLLESNLVEHILRLVQIKLYRNELDEAEANLDFFKEISSTLKLETSEVGFLEAFLYFLKRKSLKEIGNIGRGKEGNNDVQVEEYFSKSDELYEYAMNGHLASIKSLTPNWEFYKTLNASFLLELSTRFLKDTDLCFTFSKYGLKQIGLPKNLFAKNTKMLELLVQKLPGISSASLMLVKTHLLEGNIDVGQGYIDKILEKDCLVQEIHIYALFVALIKARANNSGEEAQRVLGNSTSSNFELLQNPEFLYLKAQTEILAKNYQAAAKSLGKSKEIIEGSGMFEKQMEMYNDSKIIETNNSLTPKLKAKQTTNKKTENQKIQIRTNHSSLKAEVECELAVVHTLLGDQVTGRELINSAIGEFAGTPSAIFVVLANSDIASINKDLKTAIEILKNVDTYDQGFVISRKKLAEIYLNQLKQKRSFILSLQEISDRFPGIENQLVLANGYFSIAEFEDAQKIYESLGRKNPENEEIALRIGECLVQTHNFVKARNYFVDLINSSPDCLSYKIFLCELLRNTLKPNEISKYLSLEMVTKKEARNETEEFSFVKNVENKVKATVLLSEHFSFIYKNSQSVKDFNQSVTCLQTAIDFQKTLIEHLKSGYQKVEMERKTLGELYFRLMCLTGITCVDLNLLVPLIDQAIKNDPENLSYHLLHGQIYLDTGCVEIAKEKAKQIFKTDFRHTGAIVLFADCLLQSQQIDSGIKGFTKIFAKDFATDNSTFVLTALVWFYRAAGNLPEFLKILAKYSKTANSPANENNKTKNAIGGGTDPNLNYCYGVYYYTIRNYNLAIEELAKSRSNPELLGPANLLLLDIYLHSNSFNMYSNFLQKEKFKVLQKSHLDIARTLVSELSEEGFITQKKIYTAVIEALADQTKSGEAIKLMEGLLAQASYESLSSLLLYFLALFYLKIKEKEKLKIVFQKIKELVFRPRHFFDEYFFRASLLCVDMLLYKDKLKPAGVMIEQCVNVSKGCLLSYDYLIINNEKLKESCVGVLKSAFDLTNKEDPNIGYKLARDLMNENKPHESFQVCKVVLGKYPKFKQIEKDVLLKVKEDLLANY